MQYAYDKSRTRVVLGKSTPQFAQDCSAWHKECCGLLKHVLTPCNSCSWRQYYIVETVYRISMTWTAHATCIQIACDIHAVKIGLIEVSVRRGLIVVLDRLQVCYKVLVIMQNATWGFPGKSWETWALILGNMASISNWKNADILSLNLLKIDAALFPESFLRWKWRHSVLLFHRLEKYIL